MPTRSFLRGKTALIQTTGRAARNTAGKVILYADKRTEAIVGAMEETSRRRAIQVAYNEERDHARVDRQGRVRHLRAPLARVPARSLVTSPAR